MGRRYFLPTGMLAARLSVFDKLKSELTPASTATVPTGIPEISRSNVLSGSGQFSVLLTDRPGLVEIRVSRATSGEGLRRQLAGIRRQARINATAVEVGRELHLQAALLLGPIGH